MYAVCCRHRLSYCPECCNCHQSYTTYASSYTAFQPWYGQQLQSQCQPTTSYSKISEMPLPAISVEQTVSSTNMATFSGANANKKSKKKDMKLSKEGKKNGLDYEDDREEGIDDDICDEGTVGSKGNMLNKTSKGKISGDKPRKGVKDKINATEVFTQTGLESEDDGSVNDKNKESKILTATKSHSRKDLSAKVPIADISQKRDIPTQTDSVLPMDDTVVSANKETQEANDCRNQDIFDIISDDNVLICTRFNAERHNTPTSPPKTQAILDPDVDLEHSECRNICYTIPSCGWQLAHRPCRKCGQTNIEIDRMTCQNSNDQQKSSSCEPNKNCNKSTSPYRSSDESVEDGEGDIMNCPSPPCSQQRANHKDFKPFTDDDHGKSHKKLEEFCQKFLGIVSDNIMDLIENSIGGIIRESCCHLEEKMDDFMGKVKGIELKIAKMHCDITEKMAQHAEDNRRDLHSLIQLLKENQTSETRNREEVPSTLQNSNHQHKETQCENYVEEINDIESPEAHCSSSNENPENRLENVDSCGNISSKDSNLECDNRPSMEPNIMPQSGLKNRVIRNTRASLHHNKNKTRAVSRNTVGNTGPRKTQRPCTVTALPYSPINSNVCKGISEKYRIEPTCSSYTNCPPQLLESAITIRCLNTNTLESNHEGNVKSSQTLNDAEKPCNEVSTDGVLKLWDQCQ